MGMLSPRHVLQCEGAAELVTPWVAAGGRVLACADGCGAEPGLCLSKGLHVPGLVMHELVCEEVSQGLPVLTAPPATLPFHLSSWALPTVPAPCSASSVVSTPWAGGKAPQKEFISGGKKGEERLVAEPESTTLFMLSVGEALTSAGPSQ